MSYGSPPVSASHVTIAGILSTNSHTWLFLEILRMEVRFTHLLYLLSRVPSPGEALLTNKTIGMLVVTMWQL